METITLSKNESLRLAAQALKRWADYGEEMRKIGRGADCSFLAVGIPAHDLVSLIEESMKQDWPAHPPRFIRESGAKG